MRFIFTVHPLIPVAPIVAELYQRGHVPRLEGAIMSTEHYSRLSVDAERGELAVYIMTVLVRGIYQLPERHRRGDLITFSMADDEPSV